MWRGGMLPRHVGNGCGGSGHVEEGSRGWGKFVVGSAWLWGARGGSRWGDVGELRGCLPVFVVAGVSSVVFIVGLSGVILRRPVRDQVSCHCHVPFGKKVLYMYVYSAWVPEQTEADHPRHGHPHSTHVRIRLKNFPPPQKEDSSKTDAHPGQTRPALPPKRIQPAPSLTRTACRPPGRPALVWPRSQPPRAARTPRTFPPCGSPPQASGSPPRSARCRRGP